MLGRNGRREEPILSIASLTLSRSDLENWNNLDPKKEDDPAYLERQLEKMKEQYEPIEIELFEVNYFSMMMILTP